MNATVFDIQFSGKPECSKPTARAGKKRVMSLPHERLQQAREQAGYANAVDAARAFGWNENTYYSNENGNASFSKTAAVKYARAFRVELDWLVTGQGKMRKGRRAVPVVGYVGAGARVFPFNDAGLEPIDPPFEAPENSRSYIVRGDSMLPAYANGTYLIVQPLADARDALHRRAVVTLDDGQCLVKTVAFGSSTGLFSLHSYNAEPIRDVVIATAERVIGTVEP